MPYITIPTILLAYFQGDLPFMWNEEATTRSAFRARLHRENEDGGEESELMVEMDEMDTIAVNGQLSSSQGDMRMMGESGERATGEFDDQLGEQEEIVMSNLETIDEAEI